MADYRAAKTKQKGIPVNKQLIALGLAVFTKKISDLGLAVLALLSYGQYSNITA